MDQLNNSTPNATGEAGADTSPQGEGKTFTQDDVNRIVGERLAKEKARTEAELVQKEQELQQREILLTAKEKLAEKELSADLLEALNVSSPEALDKSIEIIETEINRIKSIPPVFKGIKPAYLGTAVFPPEHPDSIREAMGLQP